MAEKSGFEKKRGEGDEFLCWSSYKLHAFFTERTLYSYEGT